MKQIFSQGKARGWRIVIHYKVRYLRTAEKQLERLDRVVQVRIVKFVDELEGMGSPRVRHQ